ncbi:hypothetical protein Tco_1081990 [Tanacetum coccineum]|uniref:No apical meristem-associated C-terminal domain-containing protein n=1 Tax=Tanacetum coccineum TaxID=301880 RepID=A0ABQ5HZ64_9ASTR
MASTSNRCGKAKTVQRMDENGSSDLVLFQNALAEFQTGHGDPFTIEACWRILKNHVAWTEIEMPTYQRRGSSSQQHTHQPMSPISSFPTIEELANEHEICDEYLTDGYLTEQQEHQLRLDKKALRETLEEEANAEKE